MPAALPAHAAYCVCRISIEGFAKHWNDKANAHYMQCRLAYLHMQQRAQAAGTFRDLPADLQGQFPSFNAVHPQDVEKGERVKSFGGYQITGSWARTKLMVQCLPFL